jgi:hypothetical protein
VVSQIFTEKVISDLKTESLIKHRKLWMRKSKKKPYQQIQLLPLDHRQMPLRSLLNKVKWINVFESKLQTEHASHETLKKSSNITVQNEH